MKKSISVLVISILALCLVGYSIAALNASTNLALKKTAIGTYSNPAIVTDGVESAKKVAPAISNVVAEGDQYLTVDLGKLVYVDRVKAFWDLNAYPRSFQVRTSADGKYWENEASNLDAASGATDTAAGVVALSISCKRAMIGARFVQIVVPAGSGVSSGDRVKIAEVEVYPAMGQKLTLIDKVAAVITDRNAVISYTTSIGTVGGKILYGSNPNALTNVAPNQASGVENSATLYGLQAGTGYYYKIQATDLYGNAVESDVAVFATLNNNLAYKKPVTGTFTELPPADPFVDKAKPVLPRITDNSTSYFNSMATSKSVNDSDQYIVIDLGGNYPIKTVQAYWRKLAYPENYSVLVSADNANWAPVAENVNAADGSFSRSDTGDPMQVVSTPANAVTARYIKILIKQGSAFFHKHMNWNFVQLMEVRVFAD